MTRRDAAKRYRFKIETPGDMRRNPWAAWLKRHGLSIDAAEMYTRAVKVQGDGPALAMLNDSNNGHAIQLLSGGRGTAGTPNYSFFRGERRGLLHVFGSMADFLAYLSLYGRTEPSGDSYIMHVPGTAMLISSRLSISNLAPGGDQREGPRLVLWLGNSDAARPIIENFLETATRHNSKAATMGHLFEGYASLFDWYSATRPKQREADTLKQYDDTAWAMMRARPSGAGPNGPG